MQRKDVAVRNARWKTQDRVEDALEVLEDTFPSTRPDALDTEKNIEYMLHRRKEINTVREGCPAAFAKWVVDEGTRVYDAMVNSIDNSRTSYVQMFSRPEVVCINAVPRDDPSRFSAGL